MAGPTVGFRYPAPVRCGQNAQDGGAGRVYGVCPGEAQQVCCSSILLRPVRRHRQDRRLSTSRSASSQSSRHPSGEKPRDSALM